MKSMLNKGRIAINLTVAIFLALSPLLHGFHLLKESHHHGLCHECGLSGNNPSCYRLNPEKKQCLVNEKDDSAEGHDSGSCPLCRFFNQLTRSQFVLSSTVNIALRENCIRKEYPVIPVFDTAYSDNLIPRAPPVC